MTAAPQGPKRHGVCVGPSGEPRERGASEELDPPLHPSPAPLAETGGTKDRPLWEDRKSPAVLSLQHVHRGKAASGKCVIKHTEN